MKKIFASVLAIVMVLAVASSAMGAFTWNAGAAETADTFANRYKIEVVKLANETGIIGTNKLVEAPAATAVNNASVYFYIRLTVSGSDTAKPDAVQTNALAAVSFTALTDLAGTALATPAADVSLTALGNGVYYYDLTAKQFKAIDKITTANSVFSAPAIEARVQDTATAKAYAKVYSKRPLYDGTTTKQFEVDGYKVEVLEGSIKFIDASDTTNNIVTFTRNSSSGKLTKVEVNATANGNWVYNLYVYLGFSAADVEAGKIYMTNGNIRAAFGFDYKGESSITWNANPTAIILDPAIGVGIPKTGDSASVIGFAMVMIAVVGAAVAMKKVQA